MSDVLEDIPLSEDIPPIPQALECFKVLETIFHKLELTDKKNARLTCNRWRQILDEPLLDCLVFRATIRDGESAKAFMNSYRTFSTLRLEHLKETLPICTRWNPDYKPQIKQVELGKKNSCTNIAKFFKYLCGNADALFVDSSSLAPIRPEKIPSLLKATTFSNLTQLKLASFSSHLRRDKTTTKHIRSLMSFLAHAKTPKVCLLRFMFTSEIREHIDMLTELLAEFYKYLNRHTDSLRTLDLVISAGAKSGTVFAQEKIAISAGALPLEIRKSLEDNLKLKKFHVYSTFKPEDSLLLPANLNSATLTELYCTFDRWTLAEAPELQNSITKNARNLETFLITMPNGSFDMAVLRDSKCLKGIVMWAAGIINNLGLRLPTVRFLDLAITVEADGSNGSDANIWNLIINAFPNAEYIHWGEGFSTHPLDIVSDPIPSPQFQKLWLELRKLQKLVYMIRLGGEIVDHARIFCNNTPDMSCQDILVECGNLFEVYTFYNRTIRRGL